MKHLSSRWAVIVLLAPAIVVVSILMAGWGEAPSASSSGGKGYVQVAFTGSASGPNNNNPFPNFQSVLLNVIAVRFNPTTDMSLSDADGSWNTIAVAPGASPGDAFGSLSFGGSFGPNGNAISFGKARAEMQVDLALLQNNLTVFNTTRIRAQKYYQVELLLDGGSPAIVVPLCGSGQSTGEGCITYPTTLVGSSIRFPPFGSTAPSSGLFDVARNTTTLIPIAINAVLGPPPTTSTDVVSFSGEICPIRGLPTQNPIACTFGGTPPPSAAYAVGAVVQGQVHGATGSGIVEAEISGTGTVVSTAAVDSTSKRNYYMMLPAGTYDLVGSSPTGRSFDAQSHVVLSNTNNGPYNIDFNLTTRATRPVNGHVVDACSGIGISGAQVEIYGPPKWVDNIPCSPSPTPATSATPFPTPPPQCSAQCEDFSTGAPAEGCVVLATSSTNNLGVYPFSPSGSAPSAFTALPVLQIGKVNQPTGYGIKAMASGYNGRLLSVRNVSGSYKCDGSGFQHNACSFALQHGTLQVTVDTSGTPIQGNPINVLVNAEDQGTFNGEGLNLTTIPVGKTSNPGPLPISVPIYEPSPSPTAAAETLSPEAGFVAAKATPTATGTPVDIGGAQNYDLFASVQDLFGAAPQKVGGHTYAVLSGVPAPSACATAVVSGGLSGLTCVGHGSILGSTYGTADQNTLLSLSKGGVQLSQSRVMQITGNNNASICAPADPDGYTVTQYEAQPTGTPVAVGSATISLNGPTLVAPGGKTACFSICSAPTSGATPSGSPTPTKCLLCQQTTTTFSIAAP